MTPLFVALVMAPVAGGVWYATGQRRDERRNQRLARARQHTPTPAERLATEIEEVGPEVAVLSAYQRHHAGASHDRSALWASNEASRKASERDARHGAPIRNAHPNLVAYSVVAGLLGVVGVIGFVINRALEVGLIRTLKLGEAQAEVIGTILALFTALLGLLLAELILPGDAFPKLRDAPRRVRFAGGLAVGAVFLTTIGMMAHLAPSRAEAARGDEVRQAEANCLAAQQDAQADPAERSLACGLAEQRAGELEAAKTWDSMVAVAAPVAEAVGSWGLLRSLELLVAAALAASARRSGRRAAEVEARMRARWDELMAVLVEGHRIAGRSAGEIRDLQGLLDEDGAGATDLPDEDSGEPHDVPRADTEGPHAPGPDPGPHTAGNDPPADEPGQGTRGTEPPDPGPGPDARWNPF